MAFEKRLPKVDPQLFVTDGDIYGTFTIDKSCLFKVKQHVVLTGDLLPSLELEIKNIPNSTTIVVGPRGGSIRAYKDISAYTVAANAAIYAAEQNHPAVPVQEIERFVYEEEPTVAYRTIHVDKHGDLISSENPLPVEIAAQNAETPNIYNLSVPLKNTEYSQLLPNGTKHFSVRARNNARLQFSYTSGESNTNFFTIMPGNIYTVDSVILTDKTIFLQSSKDSTIVEILAWT